MLRDLAVRTANGNRGASAAWRRIWSYVATAPDRGHIVAREHCTGA